MRARWFIGIDAAQPDQRVDVAESADGATSRESAGKPPPIEDAFRGRSDKAGAVDEA
jgi:hypothetical protein